MAAPLGEQGSLTMAGAKDVPSRGFAAERPIMLVSAQACDGAGGGAVILRSLLEKELGNGVLWATPSCLDRDVHRGHLGLRRGSLGRLGRRSVFLDATVFSGALTREVLALVDQFQVAGLWLVLHQDLVHLAARLIKAGRLPVHVTVHDDPVYATALRSRRHFVLAPLIARDLAFALRHAASVDVVSTHMGRYYERKYGVTSIVLHRGLRQPVSPGPAYDLARDGLTVGVLGNMYTYSQLPVLARAVISAAKVLGVRGKLFVCGLGFGDRLRQEFAGQLDVEASGHLPEQEAIECLRRCFLLYLNYPFRAWHRVLRETSFPTKLSTYIYAARPLLVHAPPGTSLADLPSTRGYTTTWASMDPATGAHRMVEFARSSDAITSYHPEAEEVRQRYYDYATNRAHLDRILRQLADCSPRAPVGVCRS
jgi:glycosyltransferase involved in cell wall biosynthesis